MIVSDKKESESLAKQEKQGSEREFLRLSDIDRNRLNDLQSMFGLWKEADHCDITHDVANDVRLLRNAA